MFPSPSPTFQNRKKSLGIIPKPPFPGVFAASLSGLKKASSPPLTKRVKTHKPVADRAPNIMSISANQLRPGNIIEYDGKLWLCLESVHKTPGNLRAFVQAKMRSIKDGVQKEFRFSSTEILERVSLRERPMQFLS